MSYCASNTIQISEFVHINKAHLCYTEHCSFTAIEHLTKYSNRTVTSYHSKVDN